jgi:hypothetical protein
MAAMFKLTDPQISLFECQFLLPPEKVARLQRSWAPVFRDRVLPLIDEELFREAFSADNGRPNASIQLLVAVHLLKDWDDLTDGQVLDNLEFNLQWHYALAIEPAVAHLCQKTLHNFRVKLMQNERAQQMFVGITSGLVEMDGLAVGRQRLDSTHAISDIAILTRLGLFVETVTSFLKELRRALPERLAELESGYAKRYLDREGYFADAKKEQARRRMPAVAADVYGLVRAFEHDEEVCGLVSYQLLARLFEEQCEVVEGAQPEAPRVGVVDERCGCGEPGARQESDGSADAGQAQVSRAAIEPTEGDSEELPRREDNERTTGAEERPEDADALRACGEESEIRSERPGEPTGHRGDETSDADPALVSEEPPKSVRLKEGREIGSESLQSPHDPDATYGRKGKGYEVQVAETCEQGNPYQVITAIEVNGAHESDQNATVRMVNQLFANGVEPTDLLADTGYGSGQNIIDCAKMGVSLLSPVPDPDAPKAPDPWEEPAGSIGSHHAPDGPGGSPSSGGPADANRPMEMDTFTFNDTFDKVLGCAAGHAPHQQHLDASGRTITATFSAADCCACPLASCCPTRLRKTGERTLRCSTAGAATAHRQKAQTSDEFKDRYKMRSGIESTNAELKGRHGAGRLRVRGGERVGLAMKLKAMAVNTKRAVQHHTARIRELAQCRLSDGAAMA